MQGKGERMKKGAWVSIPFIRETSGQLACDDAVRRVRQAD